MLYMTMFYSFEYFSYPFLWKINRIFWDKHSMLVMWNLFLYKTPVLIEISNFFPVSNRDSILKTLPALRVLNGDMLNSYANDRIEEHYHQDLRCLLALCQYQLQEFNLLPEKYITQKR